MWLRSTLIIQHGQAQIHTTTDRLYGIAQAAAFPLCVLPCRERGRCRGYTPRRISAHGRGLRRLLSGEQYARLCL